jgi:hypothetical protein
VGFHFIRIFLFKTLQKKLKINWLIVLFNNNNTPQKHNQIQKSF